MLGHVGFAGLEAPTTFSPFFGARLFIILFLPFLGFLLLPLWALLFVLSPARPPFWRVVPFAFLFAARFTTPRVLSGILLLLISFIV